jgi:ABC-2 type transport system permease protein
MFFPGILIMILFSTCLMTTVGQLVEYRKQGTFQLFQLSPVRMKDFIFGQVGGRLLVSVLHIIFYLGLGVVLGLMKIQHFLPTLGMLLFGVAMMLTLAFILSSWFTSIESANMVLVFAMMPMIFLSGAFMPLEMVPDIFRTIAFFIPLTYLVDALKEVLLATTAPLSVGMNLVITLGWSVVFFLIAVVTFRWNLKKQ